MHGRDEPIRDAPIIWSLWHWQSTTDDWMAHDDELPHLLLGYFARRSHAEEARERLRHRPGLLEWKLGFWIGYSPLDDGRGWDQGFYNYWGDDANDDAPSADPADVQHLPEPTPTIMPQVVFDVWHFQFRYPAAPIDPWSAKAIGLFSSPANASAAIAHRRRQPGFCKWPDGFRCYQRRLGVAFGLDGLHERYGWEAWRDSIRPPPLWADDGG